MTKNQFENFRLRRRTPVLATVLALIFLVVLFRSSSDKILISLVVGLAYLTGIISLFFGIVFSILGYMAALPIISTLYAYIAFILAKIHYIIFRVFVNKTLRRMRWYRKMELRVKNSSIVKNAIKITHGFLQGLGIDRSRKVKFFEVTKCRSCKKDIPIDGALCPYCSEKIETTR
jgi:Zn-dependent protease with chaperone function